MAKPKAMARIVIDVEFEDRDDADMSCLQVIDVLQAVANKAGEIGEDRCDEPIVVDNKYNKRMFATYRTKVVRM